MFGDLRYLQKPGVLPLDWKSVLTDWGLNIGQFFIPFPVDFLALAGVSLMGLNMIFIWIYDQLMYS
jgi:hypothetical protein